MTTAEQSREAFHDALTANSGDTPCQSNDFAPDLWFADPGTKRAEQAKSLCAGCPMLEACRGYAIEQGIPSGVWGGVDEKQREQIWNATGGKPPHFNDEMDTVTLAMLQQRRDREHEYELEVA